MNPQRAITNPAPYTHQPIGREKINVNRIVAVSAVALGIGLSLVGCGSRPDPCTTLAPPTSQEVAAAAAGADVEREVELDGHEYECELVDNTWQEEQDTD